MVTSWSSLVLGQFLLIFSPSAKPDAGSAEQYTASRGSRDETWGVHHSTDAEAGYSPCLPCLATARFSLYAAVDFCSVVGIS